MEQLFYQNGKIYARVREVLTEIGFQKFGAGRGKQGIPGIPGPPGLSGWLLDGNTNGFVKYIGTNDNFDFPIYVNGIEIARFLVPTVAGFNNDGRFFINQILPDNGSNAGGQLSALRPNRAQWRFNQYGANNAGGGITTFKSRNLVVGAPLNIADAVLVGDIIQGLTGIGVTNNGLIPLAYLQRVKVSQNANGNVSADWELSLCPLRGTTNSIRKTFAVSSEGVIKLREAISPAEEAIYPSVAGVVTLGVGGTLVVPNLNVSANTRFALTIQDGGAVPTGAVYISARTIGTDFTIQSMTNDAGVKVYWQMFEPQPVVAS